MSILIGGAGWERKKAEKYFCCGETSENTNCFTLAPCRLSRYTLVHRATNQRSENTSILVITIIIIIVITRLAILKSLIKSFGRTSEASHGKLVLVTLGR